jgi:hypothetical protein
MLYRKEREEMMYKREKETQHWVLGGERRRCYAGRRAGKSGIWCTRKRMRRCCTGMRDRRRCCTGWRVRRCCRDEREEEMLYRMESEEMLYRDEG